jgi:hypothetical protein
MPVEINQYIYGNSLVNFAGGSEQSNVPYWMNQFAEAGGNTYAANGGYGFLRQFADREEPSNEWGFEGVTGLWDSDFADFDEVAFDSVILTPGNFIQGLAPNEPYPSDSRSPLEASIDVVRDTMAEQPNAQFYIYEGWADLGSNFGFPVSDSQLQQFHDYNAGEYHDWYVEYVEGINDAVPGADVQLIPVASTMAELFTDGPLQDLTLDDLYVDSAPHGTETVYFLASMITYQATFGEPVPADFEVPNTVDPLVIQSFDAINTRIAEVLGTDGAEPTPPPVVVEPNSDPIVESEYTELSQGDVAVIDVLANDSDPDGDTLTLQSAGNAQNGSVEIIDGRVVYMPNEGFSGSDSITYVVTDNEGGFVEGVVTVQVLADEPAPEPEPIVVELNSDPIVAGEYTELSPGEVGFIDVLANDSDPDGDALSLQSVGGAANGSVEIVDGRVLYTPNDGFAGRETISYVVTDNQGGFVEGELRVQVLVGESTPEPEPTPEPPVTGGIEGAGFAVAYFRISDDVTNLSQVDFDAAPTATGTVDALQYIEVSGEFSPEVGADNFASIYTTVLNVTEAGAHEIFLLADDYARVMIDGEVVIDTSDTEAGDLSSRWYEFEEGAHEIQVQYIEIDGEQSLNLDWAGPSTGGAVEALAGEIPSDTEEGVEPPAPVEPEALIEPVELEPSVELDTPEAEPQTAFAATAIETNATSLNDLDFASHAGVSQIINGVTLASDDDTLLDGGPSEGAVQFTAQISVETSGLYEIGLASDEQAQVNISGLPVVNTGADDDGAIQSNSIFLTSGTHNVEVQYLDTNGPQALNVTWSGPDTEGEPMPIGDSATDAVAALFSTDVAARSDEEALEIATKEADDAEKEELLIF